MAQRRKRSAFGSVTEVAPGKKYVVRWVQNTDEGRRRVSKTVRGTRKDASRLLAQKELEHGAERPTPTVGQAFALWYLPWLERRVAEGKASEGTARAYRSAWASACAPRWADVPLDRVRPLDVQAWLSGLTKGTAATALKVLRAVGDLAVRWEAAEQNKFRLDYEMPGRRARERSKAVLDLAGCEAALASVRGAAIEPCVILAAFGGLRVGESCAPRLDDVRELEGWAAVRVSKQMPNGDADLPVDALKTDASEREALVPPPYAARLLEIAEERRAFGTAWLCDRGDGRPITQPQLRYQWAKAGGPVPFQNLRNSWRTLAQMEWGVDWDTCELLMGHRLPGVTGAHYMRPTTEQLKSKMAEALAGSGHLS